MTLEQEAQDGERVKQFLGDDAIKAAFARIDTLMFGKFKDAQTEEQRLRAWAVAQAVDEIQREMRVVVSTGERARDELGKLQRKSEMEHERAKRQAGRF